MEDFEIINSELVKYNLELENRPQIIAANKTDIIQDEDAYNEFLAAMKDAGYEVFPISAATGEGLSELMKHTYTTLQSLPPIQEFEIELDINEEEFIDKTDKGFEINIEDGVYVISGTWIEAVGGSVNFSDSESLQFFQQALKNHGVIDALADAGISEGDTVRIGDLEFEFVW